MVSPTIAWLANDKMVICAFIASMEIRGFSTVHHRHAGPAIEDFLRGNEYSLIVVSPDIAPSFECNDSVIKKLMANAPEGRNPDYWKIGLRVVELTRSSGSINRETPIVVAGLYDPERSILCPEARDKFLRAGATEYVELTAVKFDFDKFYGRLEQLARRT